MQEIRNIEEHVLWYQRPGIEAQPLASLVLDAHKDTLNVAFRQPSNSLSEADLRNISTVTSRILSLATQFCGGAACLEHLKQGLTEYFFLSQSQMQVTSELRGDAAREYRAPVLDLKAIVAQTVRFMARAGTLIPNVSRTDAFVGASLSATVLVCLSYTISQQVASEELTMESYLRAKARTHLVASIPSPAVASIQGTAEPVIVSNVRTVSKPRRRQRRRLQSRANSATPTKYFWPASVPEAVPETRLLSLPDLPIKQAKARVPIILPIQEAPPAPKPTFSGKVVRAVVLPLKKLGDWLQ